MNHRTATFLRRMGTFAGLSSAVAALARRRDRPGPTPSDWVSATDITGPLAAEISSQTDRGGHEHLLRVVTYNVHGASRPKQLATQISRSDALRSSDVFLFQEIDHPVEQRPSRTAQLAELLGANYFYAPARLIRDFTHGLAIVSRYPLSSPRVLELKPLTTKFGWDRRIALAATIAVNGQRILLLNVHLDTTINPRLRREQIEPVAKTAVSHRGPVVVGGDVNTIPVLWAARTLPVFYTNQRGAFDRYMRKCGLMTPITSPRATHRSRTRLDAFYTRHLDVGGHGVDRTIHLSDHYPVWLRAAVQSPPRP